MGKFWKNQGSQQGYSLYVSDVLPLSYGVVSRDSLIGILCSNYFTVSRYTQRQAG